MKIIIKKIKVDSKLEKYMFFAGIAVFILSNTYFGWNKEAQSGAEKVCDIIWNILAVGGAFWWFINKIVEEALNNIKDISIKEYDE